MLWAIIAEKRSNSLSRACVGLYNSRGLAVQGMSACQSRYPRHVLYLEVVNWPSLVPLDTIGDARQFCVDNPALPGIDKLRQSIVDFDCGKERSLSEVFSR